MTAEASAIVSVVVPVVGLILQGAVGYTLLQVLRGEVTILRSRSDDHAQLLARHGERLTHHDNEIHRLRDGAED